MKTETKTTIGVIVLLIICGLSFFTIGYINGFDDGKENMKYLDRIIDESEDFIFLCNEYDEPYYSCPHDKQFMNISGLYCNGTLVCQNSLRFT